MYMHCMFSCEFNALWNVHSGMEHKKCLVHVLVDVWMYDIPPYLYIPEPWFQFIDAITAILESEQSKVEGPSRVETLVGRMVDVLTQKN